MRRNIRLALQKKMEELARKKDEEEAAMSEMELPARTASGLTGHVERVASQMTVSSPEEGH